MIPAISTVCMSHQNWRDALATAAGAGFRHVEILMIHGWQHLHPGDFAIDDLRRELDRHGLTAIGLHAGGLDGNSSEALAICEKYIGQVIAIAGELQIGMVNFNGMPVPNGTTHDERRRMLDRMAAGIIRLRPQLQAAQVRVVIENHANCHVETLADWQHLFAAIPDDDVVGATLDTGHCTLVQADIPATARALGRRIQHVHVKDHIGSRSVALGAGETDNRGLLRELAVIGYRGFLSVELEIHDPDERDRAIQTARPSLDHLLATA